MIIKGKKIAENIYNEIKSEISKYSSIRAPFLAIIQVGNNLDSKRYIQKKIEMCSSLGIKSDHISISEDSSITDLINTIHSLNLNNKVDGIIVQMPLPQVFIEKNQKIGENITRTIINEIDPNKDIDGLTTINIGKYIVNDDSGFIPATAMGVMEIIKSVDFNLEGVNAVVIGRSFIVGKPVASLLSNSNATVSILHSKTKNLSQYLKNADLIVSASGVPGIITSNLVKDGVFIIDVGTTVNSDMKLVGDVKFDEVSEKCSYITPVPGGVGPLTVCFIIKNLIKSYTRSLNNNEEKF